MSVDHPIRISIPRDPQGGIEVVYNEDMRMSGPSSSRHLEFDADPHPDSASTLAAPPVLAIDSPAVGFGTAGTSIDVSASTAITSLQLLEPPRPSPFRLSGSPLSPGLNQDANTPLRLPRGDQPSTSRAGTSVHLDTAIGPFDSTALSTEPEPPDEFPTRSFKFKFTKKRKRKLDFQGYTYNRNRKEAKVSEETGAIDVTEYWLCDYQGCSKRARTKNDVLMSAQKNHDHPLNPSRADLIDVDEKFMEKVAQDTMGIRAPRAMYGEATMGLSFASKALLKPSTFTQKAQRYRKKLFQGEPDEPDDPLHLEVPEEFELNGPRGILDEGISADSLYVLYDSREDENFNTTGRILLLGSLNGLKRIASSRELHADGQFHTAPRQFDQVYSIHSRNLINGSYIVKPAVFALLTHKSMPVYKKVLEKVKEQVLAIDPGYDGPDDFILDFEKAAINAVMAVFQNARIGLCLFHLCQSLDRHIQKVGLRPLYSSNPDFALRLRMLAALAFVDPREIPDVFDEMVARRVMPHPETEPDPRVKEVVRYFRDTYIYKVDVNGDRIRPRYPPEQWSVHHRTMDHVVRANNNAESWHSNYSKTTGPNRVGFRQALKNLKVEANITDIDVIQQRIRGRPRLSKKALSFVAKGKELEKAVADYQNWNDRVAFTQYVAALVMLPAAAYVE